jgi:hypothetical protein
MTEQEIMDHIRGGTPLFKVMCVLSDAQGELEQANMQRQRPTPVEARGMQLDAVNRIINKAVEVGLVTRKQ